MGWAPRLRQGPGMLGSQDKRDGFGSRGSESLRNEASGLYLRDKCQRSA